MWLCFHLTSWNLALSSQNSSETSITEITDDVLVNEATTFFYFSFFLPSLQQLTILITLSILNLFLRGLTWQHTILMHTDVSNKAHWCDEVWGDLCFFYTVWFFNKSLAIFLSTKSTPILKGHNQNYYFLFRFNLYLQKRNY